MPTAAILLKEMAGHMLRVIQITESQRLSTFVPRITGHYFLLLKFEKIDGALLVNPRFINR